MDESVDIPELIQLKWQVDSMRETIRKFDTTPFMKDRVKSEELKSRGNHILSDKKDPRRSLRYYNESLKYCPSQQDQRLLSFLHANRSLALFQLSKFDSSLVEIDRALQSGYPDEMRGKLMKRKTSCLEQIKGRTTEPSTTSPGDIHGNKQDARNKKKEDETNKVEHHLHIRYVTPSIGVFSGSNGREVQATDDVRRGDILLREEAFTWILLPDFYHQFCYHCLRKLSDGQGIDEDDDEDDASHPFPILEKEEESRLPLPYPCLSCHQVSFCSIKCRSESWDGYHKHECCYLNLIHQMDGQIFSAYLTLRVLMMAGGVGSFFDGKDNSMYGQFDSLCHHPFSSTEEETEYRKKASFILAFLLEKGEASSRETKLSLTQLKSAQDIICRHISQCQVNSFYMTYRDVQVEEGPAKDIRVKPPHHFPCLDEKRVGCGTYLTLSLVNHSCDPNARVTQFDGKVVTLMACRDIPKGEEVLISYGFFAKYHSFAKRQKEIFETYRFVCGCTSCQLKEEPQVNAFRCPRRSCQGPVIVGMAAEDEEDDKKTSTDKSSRIRSFCLKCQSHNHLDITHSVDVVSSGSRALTLGIQKSLTEGDDDDDSHEGEKYLKEGYSILSSVLHENDMQMAIASDILSAYYKRRRKFQLTVDYAVRTLQVVETSFDEDTYLFNTLFKVVDAYRFLLLDLKIQRNKTDSKKMSSDEKVARRDARKYLDSFLLQMKYLLPVTSPEASFYVKTILLPLRQLIEKF